MQSLNKVAIGRVVMRSKERLVAIRPIDGALCVETMRYADEVVPVHDLVPETDAELSEKERTMARQLVESLAADGFEPAEVPRPVPRAAARSHRAQGVGRRDHRRAADRAAREGARSRRRARSVDREVEDREGSPPDRCRHAEGDRGEGLGRDREARDEVDREGHQGAGQEGGARQAQRLTDAAQAATAAECSSASQPHVQTGEPAWSAVNAAQGSHWLATSDGRAGIGAVDGSLGMPAP